MIGAHLAGANMFGAYMANANMRNASIAGAILPNGIVRSAAPQPEPKPEPKPEPEAAPAPDPSIHPIPLLMDPFPDSEAVANALALVLEAHRRWLHNELGGVQLDLRNARMRAANMVGADMSNANMRAANMRGAYMANANMRGATLPHGIVRITAPESEAEPEATPAAAERRRIEWFKRYENPNGTQTIYARDQDGRVWWLVLHADAPDTWTEITPLPSYQEKP